MTEGRKIRDAFAEVLVGKLDAEGLVAVIEQAENSNYFEAISKADLHAETEAMVNFHRLYMSAVDALGLRDKKPGNWRKQ